MFADVAVGDRVVGAADFAGSTSAGAADFALLDHWARLPAHLDFVEAAALPMAIETAGLHLEALHVAAGQTIAIHGAGTTIGFAAATAGETYAERLRGFGAQVTPYGAGMAERIAVLAGAPVDLVLDTSPAVADPALVAKLAQGDRSHRAPISDALVELIRAAGGGAHRVVTISNMAAASMGVRTSFDLMRPGDATPAARTALLREYVDKVSVPVARTFALEQWREALAISLSGQARGKLVLIIRE